MPDVDARSIATRRPEGGLIVGPDGVVYPANPTYPEAQAGKMYGSGPLTMANNAPMMGGANTARMTPQDIAYLESEALRARQQAQHQTAMQQQQSEMAAVMALPEPKRSQVLAQLQALENRTAR